MFDDIIKKTRGETDHQLARTVARECGPTIDWLMDRHKFPFDVELAWRNDFGHSVPRLHGLPSRTGGELLGRLVRSAEDAGATLTTNAHVVDVYADSDDRVRGVGIERPDGTRETLGCDALVLATCGFGANREMIRRYIPDMGESPYFGHEGDDGAGIQWGIDLGAATADMAAFQGYGALSIEFGVLVNYNIIMEGGIQVNARGERFSDELFDISGQSKQVLAQPNGVAWVIYDDRLRQSALRWPEYQQLTKLAHGQDRAGCACACEGDRHTGGCSGENGPRFSIAFTAARQEKTSSAATSAKILRSIQQLVPTLPRRSTGALFHTQGGLVVDTGPRHCDRDGSPTAEPVCRWRHRAQYFRARRMGLSSGGGPLHGGDTRPSGG